MMLAPKQFDPVNRDLEIRDLYNMEDAFHLAEALPGRVPGAAERQPRLLGRPRRQDRLAAGRRRHHPLTELVLADYLVVDVGQAVRRAGLVPRDRARRARRARARDLRRPGAQRRRDGHDLHAADQRRQRAR